MPKKLFEDVLRPTSRSTPKGFLSRNSVARSRTERRKVDADDTEVVSIQHKKLTPPPGLRPLRSHRRRNIIVGIVALAVFGIGGYFLSQNFVRARVQVEPRVEAVNVDTQLSAVKGGKEGKLHFQVMELDGTDSVSVPATGKEKVEKKASGTVVLYNAYSTKPQKLVATTRLQATGGKVFRLPVAVTIPGSTTEKGVIVPGSIEVRVDADAVGPEYNIGLVDFTIPGFEGSPKYTKIYGRSKTTMTGGFSATVNVAPPEVVAAARLDLEKRLTSRLKAEVVKDIPAGFIGSQDLVAASFEATTDPASGTSTDMVIVGKSSVVGIMIDSAEFASQIAASSVKDYTGESVEIPDISSLTFSFPDGAPDFANLETVDFHIGGNAKIVWLFDEEQLKAKLAGKSPADYPLVFSDFPMVRSLLANMSFPWVGRIPLDTSRITLERIIK